MNVTPLLVLGGIAGAIALTSKKKPKRRKRSTPQITGDPTIDIVVPAPADGNVVLSDVAQSTNKGMSAEWVIASHEGRYGWQYITSDGASEMSYLNGMIYHYPSAESALLDLMTVLGVTQ